MHCLQVFGLLILSILCVANALSIKRHTSTNATLNHLEISTEYPDGYKRYQNSFYKFHVDRQVWEEARKICVFEGGHLVIINSADEANYIIWLMEQFNPMPGDHSEHVLIGFHDLFQHGSYVTIDGRDLEYSGYTKWCWGEPHNNGEFEHCGSFSRKRCLTDFKCDWATHFVCEIPVDTCNELLRTTL